MYTFLALIGMFFLVGIFKPMAWHKKIKVDNRWKNAGIFVLVMMIASPFAPENPQTNKNIVQKEQKQNTTSKKEPTKKPVPKTYTVGEEVDVSNRTFIVNKVDELDEIKDPMGTKYPAGDGARFIKINITVKNKKKQEETINSNEIKLISKDNTEYSTDSTNEIWANPAGQSFFFQPVNPGVSKTANILFSIPKDIPLTNLRVKVTDGGLVDDVLRYIEIGGDKKTSKSQKSESNTYKKVTTAKKEVTQNEKPDSKSVYYPNCKAAKAAGVAPLYKGDPGYRSGLDRDKDGEACE